MSPRTRQSTLNFRIRKNPVISDKCDKNDNLVGKLKIPSKDLEASETQELIQHNDNAIRTPRKNNSLINISCLTPSTAFATLDIDSPKGFKPSLQLSSTELPCRELELKEIETFLSTSVLLRRPAGMYISGLPGTGKTAALTMVLENQQVEKECHTIFVNCTSVKSSGAIYLRIAESLKLKLASRTEKVAINAIEKYLFKKPSRASQKMVLLVLDEIDQLESKFQTVLYKIFEWPSKVCSRLVLIGIANAVDLTDRMLPRLRSLQQQPTLLHFRPYTKDQIVTILKHKLAQSQGSQIFAPGSLELISAKVAGQSGDLRRALDLGRRVLEVSKTRSSPSFPKKYLNSPEKLCLKGPKISSIESNTPKKVQEIIISETTPRSSPRKRPLCASNDIDSDESLCKTPKKALENTPYGIEKENLTFVTRKSPRKTPGKNISLGSPISIKLTLNEEARCESSPILRRSPRKQLFLKTEAESIRSPAKYYAAEIKRSPRKQLFPNSIEVSSATQEMGESTSVGSMSTIRACDVMSVVAQVQGSASSLKTDQSAFPLHQKLLVCSFLLILTKGKNKDVTIGKLHEVYARVCGRRGISAVDQSGFISLCRQVEMTGAVEVGKGHGRLAKITLQWDETEVSHALKDSTLLTAIMCDSSVLSKKQ